MKGLVYDSRHPSPKLYTYNRNYVYNRGLGVREPLKSIQI